MWWHIPTAAVTVAATLTLTSTAAAAAGEYLTPVDAGGVTVLGRARNESCSVTTTFKSADGQSHTVTVNQHPKWGPATVVVPAGGQVTVVVNGDLVTPYLVTVDDAVTVVRPVPTVTPGGVDCGPTTTTVPAPTTTVPAPPETTVETRVTPTPEPLVPQVAPPVTVTPPGGSTTTSPPPVVDPPGISLTSSGPECGPDTLPCTGLPDYWLRVAAVALAGIAAGAVIVVVGAWWDRKGRR